MADDFDAGICSGSWWNIARIGSRSSGGGGGDASAMGAAASVSCSSAITDTSGSSGGAALSWLSTADAEPGSSASCPGLADASILPVVPGFGGLSHAPSMNWNNQTLLSTSTERETSFHNMLQEPTFSYDNHLPMSAQEINPQQFLMQQQQQQPGFPVMLQGLYDPEAKPQQKSVYDQRNATLSYHHQPSSSSLVMGTNYQASTPNDSFAKFTQLLKSSSPPKQQPPSISSISTNHLQFSNDAPFWNPSVAASVIGDVKSGVYPPPAPIQQFVTQSFEQKPNCGSITTKANSGSAAKKSSSSSSSGEASLKKPRIDTPSPLPAFKVRKEKLGDRITALQQLVSPFGKTDTASVLHEAIDYIKFLHDQVNMLSTPYMKNGNPTQHQQSSDKSKEGEGTKQDLRSRGLCLVPMESIYPVASETMADLWTPTFGGTYR